MARRVGGIEMYLLTAIAGLAVGLVVWLFMSHWIAASIAWVEDHRPELVGSRRLRAAEALVCGAVFLGCLALAFWLAWVFWIQIK
jgi:hypothetical protein